MIAAGFDHDTIKTPKNVVLWAEKYGCLDDWAMFLLYKRVYRSSHFLTLKVPQQLQITKPTFKRWVNIFIDHGWAESFQDKSFRLKSIYKISQEIKEPGLRFQEYHYFKRCSKSELRTKLRWLLIQQRHSQIRFAQSVVKSGIHYSENRKYPKSLLKIVMANLPTTVPMSLSQMGKSMNKSKPTAFREKNKLKKLRLLWYDQQDKEVVKENVSYFEWKYSEFRLKGNYYFWQNDSYKRGLIIKCNPDIVKLMPEEIPTRTHHSSPFLNNTVPSSFTYSKPR